MTRRSLLALVGTCVGFSVLMGTMSLAFAANAAAPAKDITPPSDVEKLSGVTGDGMVTLTWSAATDDTGTAQYRVYVGPDEVMSTNTAAYAEHKDVGNVTTYDLKGIDNGKTYYVAITALDAAGNESENYSPYLTVSPLGAAVGGDAIGDAAAAIVAAATPSISDAAVSDMAVPHVKNAQATYSKQVKVIFNKPIKLPLVKPEKAFSIQDNLVYDTLNVTAATMDVSDVTGATILLTTGSQNPDSDYVLTASSDIKDLKGTPLVGGEADVAQFKGSAITKEIYDATHPSATPVATTTEAVTTTATAEVTTDASPFFSAADTKTPLKPGEFGISKIETKSDTVIHVVFTNPIVLNTDPTLNFSIVKKSDASGAKLTLSSIVVDKDKKGVLITATMEPETDYTLNVADVVDSKGAKLVKDSTAVDFKSQALVKDVKPPEDVANFAGTVLKNMAAKLSWKGSKNSAGDLVEYIIYRSTDGKKYGQLTSLSKENTAYQLDALEPGNHYYKITAKDTSGNESKGKTVRIHLAETGPEIGFLIAGSMGLGQIFGLRRRKKNGSKVESVKA